MCSTSFLRVSVVLVGVTFICVSIFGLCLTLFLLFGDPWQEFTRGTYSPSAEDIVPLFILSIATLLMNMIVIGGALQYSTKMLVSWIFWTVTAVIIFWLWFGYNQLKHYGYIDWTRQGMKGCYFCGLTPEEGLISTTGVGLTAYAALCTIPVMMLHSKFKRRYLELTEPQFFYDSQSAGPPVGFRAGKYGQPGMPHQNPLPPAPAGYSYQYQAQPGLSEYKF